MLTVRSMEGLGPGYLFETQPAAQDGAWCHEHERCNLRPDRPLSERAEQRDCGTECQHRRDSSAMSQRSSPRKPGGRVRAQSREDHANGDAAEHDWHGCIFVRLLARELEERKCRQREDEVPDNNRNYGSDHVPAISR